MLKTKKTIKKVIAMLLTLVMLCCSLPINVMAADITDIGENSAEFGVIEGSYSKTGHELHYAKYDGQTYITFCTQWSIKSPVGREYNSSEFIAYKNKEQATYRTIAKYIYFGYTMIYGDGLPDTEEEYKAACATQQFVWETLGVAPSRTSWKNAYMNNSIYEDWKAKTDSLINLYYNTMPSFHNQTITLDYGTSTTLTDTNGCLQYYPTFNQSVDGIEVKHTKGSNSIEIVATKSVDAHSVSFNSAKYGIYMGTPTGIEYNSTMNYISFEFHDSDVQNLMFSRFVDPARFIINLEVEWGKIELTKQDTYGAAIDGTKFGLYTDKNCTNQISTGTSENGKVAFDYLTPATYYVKELSASNGYLIDDKVIEVKVSNAQTSSEVITNAEPTGSITMTKNLDVSKTNGKYGDVVIGEAEYELYADNQITSKAGTKTFYEKDELVGTAKLIPNANGTTGTITWDNLPLGTYYIKEKQEPTGTFIDRKTYKVTLSYDNQNTPIIIDDDTVSTDVVKSMKVNVLKTGTNGTAGLLQGVEGAEFTIKLYADYEMALQQGYKYEEIWSFKDSTGTWKGINLYGQQLTVDAQRAEQANKVAPSYDVITTDAEGNATSTYLPYGKFIAKETVTPVDYEAGSDFTFSITNDENEVSVEKKVKQLVVNNSPFEAPVKIIKKDINSKKTVTLSSATFKIKATENVYDTSTGELLYAKGNYVQYKVGTNKYNEFQTNSDGYVTAVTGSTYASTNDEKGTVTTPFYLPAGSYEIVEIEAPNGFLLPDANKQFVVTSLYDYDVDADGDTVVTVTVENEQPKGTLVINKTFATRDNIDKTLIEDIDYTQIGFELTAAQDIIDKADGSVVYAKDEVVGTYYLDEDATLTVNELWIGEYNLKEIATIEGAVLDDTVYSVVFEATDDTTKVYTQTLDIVNYTTEVSISKTDITNEPELPGAELTVTDAEGNVIDSWTSTTKSHNIEGLKVGQTYTLTEELAPEGYVVATSIQFTIENTREVQQVTMVDKQVVVSKIDVTTGEELEGAELTVIDAEGNVIDSWTSTTTPHIVKGLVEGQTYILTEVTAPYGYKIAESIKFTVSTDKETQKIVMEDDYIYSSVRVVKCDITTKKPIVSNEFEFSIYADKDCTQLIATSGANKDEGTALFEKLKYGTYYVAETKAPLGYSLSDQVVEIVINDEGVFADGVSLEGNNGVYSFEYYDELLPIIETGDNKDGVKSLILMGGLLVVFVVIFVLVSKKMKKKK